MAERKNLIIDVRDPSEFNKGHAKGSINIPIGKMGDQIDEIKNLKENIIVVCGGGTRNKRAHELLKQHHISSTAGGSWKNY